MYNRRKLKTYKFKSAKIEIYVDENIGEKTIVTFGQFSLKEKVNIPFEYLMRISVGDKSMVNRADTLSALKSKYMLLQSKKQLREANVY